MWAHSLILGGLSVKKYMPKPTGRQTLNGEKKKRHTVLNLFRAERTMATAFLIPIIDIKHRKKAISYAWTPFQLKICWKYKFNLCGKVLMFRIYWLSIHYPVFDMDGIRWLDFNTMSVFEMFGCVCVCMCFATFPLYFISLFHLQWIYQMSDGVVVVVGGSDLWIPCAFFPVLSPSKTNILQNSMCDCLVNNPSKSFNQYLWFGEFQLSHTHTTHSHTMYDWVGQHATWNGVKAPFDFFAAFYSKQCMTVWRSHFVCGCCIVRTYRHSLEFWKTLSISGFCPTFFFSLSCFLL